MTLTKRIIPCLDIKDGAVVKGVNFVGLREVGDPVELAKVYEAQQADEIVFLDITATSDARETIYELIGRAARSLSIPLTVGGGIRTLDDFRQALAHGADKVSINSSALANPELIRQAADEFGVQCVVVAIDARQRSSADGWNVFVKGGREDTGIDLLDWGIRQAESLGAGEILLTSMDKDGTRSGYDLPQLQAVCDAVNIPVIASGGCDGITDIIEVFDQTDVDAALAASLFHYGEATIDEVKVAMQAAGIPARRVTV